MGRNSAITWTTHTWNPWYGCHRVSSGCANCYALKELKQYNLLERNARRAALLGETVTVAPIQRSRTTFDAPLSWAKRVQQPGSERVFTCSWSDFFLPEADGWRNEAWDIIRATPQLTYLILTKRPELVMDRLPKDWGRGWSHVWLGASIENQAAANHRLPILMELPAVHRFVSCEPLLGPVSLVAAAPVLPMFQHTIQRRMPNLLAATRQAQWQSFEHTIHWVIAGGESGPAARPCDPEWVRALWAELHPHIPFYFKQWGEWLPHDQQPAQGEPAPDPEFAYCRMGKRAAGYLLDGQVVQQFPRQFAQHAAPAPSAHVSGEGSSS